MRTKRWKVEKWEKRGKCDKWEKTIGEQSIDIVVGMVMVLVLEKIYVGIRENLYVLGLLQNRIIQ